MLRPGSGVRVRVRVRVRDRGSGFEVRWPLPALRTARCDATGPVCEALGPQLFPDQTSMWRCCRGALMT